MILPLFEVRENVIVDGQNHSLIICDSANRRVVRWPRRNGQRGEILISNIDCGDGYLYVSDTEKDEVRRSKIGKTEGTIVASGIEKGDHLNQLLHIFIDDNQSVYVSDRDNYCVVKWVKGAKEGVIVAGGIIVDQLGSVYVGDGGNHRVVRWLKGAAEGSIVVGGNGQGKQLNQFDRPVDFSFDQEDNLYVVEYVKNRIQ